MSGMLVMLSTVAFAATGSLPGAPAPTLAVAAPPGLRLSLADLGATAPGLDLRAASSEPLLLASDRAPAPGGDATPAPDDAHLQLVRRWERILKWSTAGALVATSTFGTIAAINQPTAFGKGRCETGNPVLGTYGCDRGLSTLHGMSAVLSTTLYTANGVLALSIPGPVGNVTPAKRPWHRALTYVHLGGIVVQPIIGLVSAFPQVIGMRNEAPGDPFPKTLRTIHVGLGYVVAAAYIATLALEQ
jgi:hypothetical protein